MSLVKRIIIANILCSFVLPAFAETSLNSSFNTTGSTGKNVESNFQDLESDVYIIGPGDVLDLQILDAPEFSGELTVLSDGSVSLPFIGTAQFSGLTLNQASSWAKTLLGDQLIRPELQLKLLRPRPIRVSVVGAVERPGLYSLTKSETTQTDGGPVTNISGLPTLVDAIQKAGGITQQANLRDVQLQRKMPGSTERFKKTTLNLLDLLLEGSQRNNPFLFDGDTIKLTRAESVPDEVIELAAVNLSPKIIQINIIGEVVKPGPIQVAASTPLMQAVMLAGGLKDWRANPHELQLIRINRNGSATLEKFRYDLKSSVSNTTNPPLRQGDTVIVRRSLLAKGTDAIGTISQPLSGIVTILSLFKLIQNTN